VWTPLAYLWQDVLLSASTAAVMHVAATGAGEFGPSMGLLGFSTSAINVPCLFALDAADLADAPSCPRHARRLDYYHVTTANLLRVAVVLGAASRSLFWRRSGKESRCGRRWSWRSPCRHSSFSARCIGAGGHAGASPQPGYRPADDGHASYCGSEYAGAE